MKKFYNLTRDSLPKNEVKTNKKTHRLINRSVFLFVLQLENFLLG